MNLGAIISLTALLSGCEENKDMVLASCDVGELQARVIYHQLSDSEDKTGLELYKDGKIVASVKPIGATFYGWLQCNDGKILNIDYHNPKVYFTPGLNK